MAHYFCLWLDQQRRLRRQKELLYLREQLLAFLQTKRQKLVRQMNRSAEPHK